MEMPASKAELLWSPEGAMVLLFNARSARLALPSTPVEQSVKGTMHAHQTTEEILAAHRRAHRSGRPGKTESDPELQAFILAGIEVHTFAEIVPDTCAAFPAERRCSPSGLSRWWRKRAGMA